MSTTRVVILRWDDADEQEAVIIDMGHDVTIVYSTMVEELTIKAPAAERTYDRVFSVTIDREEN